jgi:hypothetical protein
MKRKFFFLFDLHLSADAFNKDKFASGGSCQSKNGLSF